MEYISGINKTIAKNIVEYREANGRFTERKQLLKVPKLGPKAYQQCAGFMRILDGKNPLDATSVHPESYDATMQLLEKLGLTMEDVKEIQKQVANEKTQVKKEKPKKQPKKQVVVRNTNTAMGKALAEAFGGVTMEVEAKEAPVATVVVSGLEKHGEVGRKLPQK